MRNLIRRRTSNISRGPVDRGLASIGATTAVWWPAPYPAMVVTAAMGLLVLSQWGARRSLVQINSSKLDCFAVLFTQHRQLRLVQSLVPTCVPRLNTDLRWS